MKTIVMTTGAYRTSSALADAVMGYGLALARSVSLDVVDIPCVSREGTVQQVQLLIGWNIEIAVTATVGSAEPEPIDPDTVLGILARTRSLPAAHDREITASLTSSAVDWDAII